MKDGTSWSLLYITEGASEDVAASLYIGSLRSSIDERSREIGSKEEIIKQLETLVLEKASSLASLRSEIQSLQKKESLDAKEQESEAHGRAIELEKQVENLKDEIEKQNTKKDALEARISVAETKIVELSVSLEKLQKINEEQKIRIRNTERALQKAEDEIIGIQFRAATQSKQLAEVQESWLPSWLALHLFHCQSFMATNWNVYGRPALDIAVQKAIETEAQVRNWARPHIDAFHTKWIPAIKEQWLTFVTNMEPHGQMLTAKTVEFYHESKKTIKPHVVKLQNAVDPYIKEVQKFTNPYINQVLKTLKPHINKAHIFLKPYSKQILRGYKRVSKTTLKYHRQVRANIYETLKQNEYTRLLADDSLVWLMASAFMVFPLMIILTWVSTLFSKKSRRRTRTSHTNQTRRRVRRVHPENASTSR
ncbi:hypothetical protein Tco_1213285 [Tanacetum coccineum]